MSKKIEVKVKLDATPEEVYKAWLNSKTHEAMTGQPATISARKGAPYTAWGNYITGKNLELVPNEKIVQTWRSSDFKKSDPDSIIEIRLKSSGKGCELTLIHSEIPPNQPDYKEGWEDFYFKPIREYFSK
jgi:uncharacterized protein YndB with AHSA1/START domain